MIKFTKSHIVLPLVLLFAAFAAVFVPSAVLEGLANGVDGLREEGKL